jgi:hypothetical protein
MVALRFSELPKHLQDSYGSLVKGFGKTSSKCAPGPGATVEGRQAASFAQKLWRFCRDPKGEYPALIEPLIQRVRQETDPQEVLLSIHDWSTLGFGTHKSKEDRRTITHDNDVGYDLATALIVRARDGAPIAPVSVNLATADEILSTEPSPVADVAHIDQILPRMELVRSLKLTKKIVHVIDREADSVGHWRAWTAAGHQALVRGDDRLVLHNDQERKLTEIAEELKDTGQLKEAGEALYHGRKAWRFVGESAVVLHRPAKRREGNVQREIPGEPVSLRLVVVELRDAKGRVLSRWLLLTNVSEDDADAATIGLWYYFRWRIETMHKLLKSAGWDLESWLQQTGERLLRKMLLAFAACVEVWALERREDESSHAIKELLMALSGRQTKARQPITTSGLLAGLWVLQQAATRLSRESPNEILKQHLPLFANCSQSTT